MVASIYSYISVNLNYVRMLCKMKVKFHEMKSDLFIWCFSLVGNAGGLIMSFILIKRVWLDRSQTAKILRITRVSISLPIFESYVKMKYISIISKLASILILTFEMSKNFFIAKNLINKYEYYYVEHLAWTHFS